MPNHFKKKLVNRADLYKKKHYIKTVVFWFSWGLVKYLPSPFGDFLRFSILKIFIKQIKSWRLKEGIYIVFPENIMIGRECGINEYCHLDGYGGIKIGNFVMIGHHVTLQTTDHQIDNITDPMRYCGMLVGSIDIEDDVYIGAKAFIGAGIRVGKGAVVGAGSVVTKDIPSYAVAAGNPAKVIRYRKLKNR